MPKLFTPEFCAKLDELNMTRLSDRVVEDLYNILLEKGIISEADIYPETKKLMDKRVQLRAELKEMADKALNGGED